MQLTTIIIYRLSSDTIKIIRILHHRMDAERHLRHCSSTKPNNQQSAGFYVKDYLLSLLLDLDGIEQDPYYHPEGDALFHSLQVFQLAYQQSDSPILWAAALFHDVGKANGSKNHDKVGAEMLKHVLNDQIVWLIEHHLDLLISPAQTKRRLRKQSDRLRQLQQLRQWDLAGREVSADVISPQQALALLDPFFTQIVA